MWVSTDPSGQKWQWVEAGCTGECFRNPFGCETVGVKHYFYVAQAHIRANKQVYYEKAGKGTGTLRAGSRVIFYLVYDLPSKQWWGGVGRNIPGQAKTYLVSTVFPHLAGAGRRHDFGSEITHKGLGPPQEVVIPRFFWTSLPQTMRQHYLSDVWLTWSLYDTRQDLPPEWVDTKKCGSSDWHPPPLGGGRC
jgi:hypothetical protein